MKNNFTFASLIISLIFIISVTVGSYFGTRAILIKYMQEITPPSSAPYPSECAEDYKKFDNTTEAEMNEKQCTLTYANGTIISIPRATKSQIKFLNKHLEEAEISWINLHNGAVIVVYTITDGNTKHIYYQHIVDTNYVFYREEETTQ